MKKYLIHSIISFLLSVFMFSCITEEEDVHTGIELMIGDKIPSFSITTNTGETITDKEFAGHLSLIVFFNTGCKDCQKELPIIQQFYETYPEYPLICISRAEKSSSIAAYWKENKFTLPYSAQEDRTVYELFAQQGIPKIYIISPEGTILHIFTDNPLADFEIITQAVRNAEKKQ